MEEITQLKDIIEDRLTNLQQQVLFCLNDYDYHHRNNENEILEEQANMLSSAYTDFKSFLENMNKFKTSMASAQQKCDQVDEQLRSLGILKETTAEKLNASTQAEDDGNKENEM